MKIFVSTELGCAYRMNLDTLEFAPMMKDGTFDASDFGPVEPDLVGEEDVWFQGGYTNLYGVFDTVTGILKNA